MFQFIGGPERSHLCRLLLPTPGLDDDFKGSRHIVQLLLKYYVKIIFCQAVEKLKHLE